MSAHYMATDIGQQLENFDAALARASEHYWREEAQRCARILAGIAESALRGDSVVLHHRGQQVTLVPELPQQFVAREKPDGTMGAWDDANQRWVP